MTRLDQSSSPAVVPSRFRSMLAGAARSALLLSLWWVAGCGGDPCATNNGGCAVNATCTAQGSRARYWG